MNVGQVVECGGRCECCVWSQQGVIGSECVSLFDFVCFVGKSEYEARLAQSVERKTLNLVVVGSSPTVGDCFYHFGLTRMPALARRRERHWTLCLLSVVCLPVHARRVDV